MTEARIAVTRESVRDDTTCPECGERPGLWCRKKRGAEVDGLCPERVQMRADLLGMELRAVRSLLALDERGARFAEYVVDGRPCVLDMTRVSAVREALSEGGSHGPGERTSALIGREWLTIHWPFVDFLERWKAINS